MSVKIVPGAEPIAAEIIDIAIADLAIGMRRLLTTRLKYETIVALLHDTSGISKRDIRIVLNNLTCLEETYLKPKAKK